MIAAKAAAREAKNRAAEQAARDAKDRELQEINMRIQATQLTNNDAMPMNDL